MAVECDKSFLYKEIGPLKIVPTTTSRIGLRSRMEPHQDLLQLFEGHCTLKNK